MSKKCSKILKKRSKNVAEKAARPKIVRKKLINIFYTPTNTSIQNQLGEIQDNSNRVQRRRGVHRQSQNRFRRQVIVKVPTKFGEVCLRKPGKLQENVHCNVALLT